jgi:site-specific DNA-methyltransferase (adenine-specific)
MKQIPDNCIDTIITDPPYGLSNHSEKLIIETLLKWLNGEDDFIPKGKGMMSKSWDSFVPPPAVWKECFRVMKPGSTILVFAGTRTYDLMTISLRLAGFEIKDTLMFLYGTGFPASLNVQKCLEKAGKEEDAKRWEGWGTALKPAYEPIIMAMKPNEGSYTENALKWNVAGLNIDGGRIGISRGVKEINIKENSGGFQREGFGCDGKLQELNKGRFPANVILDEEAAKILDKQSRINASRFFYCAKASNSERNMGCEELPLKKATELTGRKEESIGQNCALAKQRSKRGYRNTHPTVKPLKLMEYLCILTKMPTDGIVLDPFVGSGTTCMAAKKAGRNYIGIEKEAEYCKIAEARIKAIQESLL